MLDPKATWVEVHPLTADHDGVYRCDDEPWGDDLFVVQDSEPHWEAERILVNHHTLHRLAYMQSSSWRHEDGRIILTYVAALIPERPVPEIWPQATRITRRDLEMYGPAGPGPTVDPPRPRDIDVLAHAIRHLRFLIAFDANARQALGPPWRRHLRELAPALEEWYETDPKLGPRRLA